MSMSSRLKRLECKPFSPRLREHYERLARELGVDRKALVADAEQNYALAQELMTAGYGFEETLRCLAEENDLDPEEVVMEGKRLAAEADIEDADR